jgi:hypothetical protein
LDVTLGLSPKFYRAHLSDSRGRWIAGGTKSSNIIWGMGERGEARGDRDRISIRGTTTDHGTTEEGISKEEDITFRSGDKGAMRNNRINILIESNSLICAKI